MTLSPRHAIAVVLTAALLSVAAPRAGAAQWKRWNEGLELARKTDRPVIVDVFTDWCGWCKRMDADVYARRDVSEYLGERFVLVRLNAESNESTSWQGHTQSARALSTSFGVTGYPTTIFLTATGQHIVNAPGYIPAERFLLLLRYIGDGHMARNESWDEYMKRAQKARPSR